jgi:hypothetical protein
MPGGRYASLHSDHQRRRPEGRGPRLTGPGFFGVRNVSEHRPADVAIEKVWVNEIRKRRSHCHLCTIVAIFNLRKLGASRPRVWCSDG